MSELKVIRQSNRSSDTAQTPGMSRVEGVARATTDAEHLWMGFVTMAPGAKSSAHHHGHCESGVYIISGRARFLWGKNLDQVSEAGPGDFIYVPPHLVHQEINPSDQEPIKMIVARDKAEGVVVNVDVQTAG